MYYDIMLTLIPPVDEHPVWAIIYVIVIIILAKRHGGQLGGHLSY